MFPRYITPDEKSDDLSGIVFDLIFFTSTFYFVDKGKSNKEFKLLRDINECVFITSGNQDVCSKAVCGLLYTRRLRCVPDFLS